jgi:hypothetical protein
MIKYTILPTRTQGELALSYSKHALSTEVSIFIDENIIFIDENTSNVHEEVDR